MATNVTPTAKVTAATLASAVSLIFWTVASATFWHGMFNDTALASLVGATATVLTATAGYLVRDRATTPGRHPRQRVRRTDRVATGRELETAPHLPPRP